MEFGKLSFWEGRKTGKNEKKNPRSKARTLPHKTSAQNGTRGTLVVGRQRSHHCAIPAAVSNMSTKSLQ